MKNRGMRLIKQSLITTLKSSICIHLRGTTAVLIPTERGMKMSSGFGCVCLCLCVIVVVALANTTHSMRTTSLARHLLPLFTNAEPCCLLLYVLYELDMVQGATSCSA